MFNARVETAKEKPSFRTPYKRRRALIPATGWYEWERVEMPSPNGTGMKEVKQPHFIFEDSDNVGSHIFAFAGLWEQWRVDEGIELLSCTILTTPALGDVKHLHHRMPVIMDRETMHAWLNRDATADDLQRMLLADQSVDLQAWRVGSKVNNPVNEAAELIEQYSA